MKEYFNMLFKCSKKEYFQKLQTYLKKDIKKFIITANPETFQIASKNHEMENIILTKTNDIVADGIGLVKLSKHYGFKIPERITGIEITYELLKICDELNKSIYLFGAEKQVLMKLIEVINREYPNIKIVGYNDGFVKNKDAVFKKIKRLKPDVCLVALGIPLQEYLINKHLKDFNKGIFIGVGGSFDVISKTKKRAPDIFIKLNLEWLYRIIKEPKRIKRFYENNIKFTIRVLLDKK